MPATKTTRPPNSPSSPRKNPRSRWKQKTILLCSIIYTLFIPCLWFFVRSEGERWWVATLFLFGPRWILATPLALLILLAAIFHRRSLLILTVATCITLFGFLGFCFPWRRWQAPPANGPMVRILTCNIHHSGASVERLAKLIRDTNPDIVALQEWSPKYQPAVFGDGQWHIVTTSELCLATHYPISYSHLLPGSHRAEYTLEIGGHEIEFFNLHLTSPHYPLSDAIHGESEGPDEVANNSSRRQTESQDLRRRVKESSPGTLLAGDFNLPPDSAIYRKNYYDFTDAFTNAGLGFGWTYHTRWTMARIDHIMSANGWQIEDCWLGPNIGSPHRPLLAELRMTDK